jgi:hypothetical protein
LALAGEILRRADEEHTAPQAMADEPQQQPV